MAALVFFTAIATQWTQFQLSLVADRSFGGDADAVTAFFGTFNFALGAISFLLQLFCSARRSVSSAWRSPFSCFRSRWAPAVG